MEPRAPNPELELVSVVAVLNHGYQTLLSLLSRNPCSFSSASPPPPKPEPSDASPRWPPTGWRRSAFVNLGLTSASLLVLIGIRIFSISVKSGFSQAWVFYTSNCKSTATSNTLLHLLANIVSTGLFASSNFFMKVLNSPSMEEVKANHSQGKWLDIGIPSWRNAFHLRTYKLVAWICLLFTSVPIHLLFNSSVFQINSRYGDFHLTIAAESFLQGGSYVLPGAALLMDTPIGFGNSSLRPTRKDILSDKYRYSTQAKNVSATATYAADWSRLDASNASGITLRPNLPFEISYCLAEQRETTCSVALSRLLLLVVALSVFSKLIISASVVWAMSSEEPLVTLGDAIAAFVCERGDPLFSGYPTDDFVRRNGKHVSSGMKTYQSIGAGVWKKHKHRRADAIPKDSWVRNSWFWVLIAVLVAVFIAFQVNSRAAFILLLTGYPAERELPGYMPLVGSNSLAVSAACKVSPLSRAPRRSTTEDETEDIELEERTPRSTEDPEIGQTADAADDIVFYPLKWGEVKMPEDWYLQDDGAEEAIQVRHLGFGTLEDDPQPPTNGRRYR
ncbi:hypothetical protein CSOJ01_11250 [Colletotrichum sojae]|uniref:DUF6536 domain-containing protein n=1 Tax=Colletotrichum sojae TaxID=2175907 RepID=A0A8H6MNY4_9PEZI|nr:hypothetical protein CSOJ01_11250 [Colletotrichum sojae]